MNAKQHLKSILIDFASMAMIALFITLFALLILY